MPADKIQSGDAIHLRLRSAFPTQTAFLKQLTPGSQVGLAYGHNAVLGELSNATQIWEASQDIWELELRAVDTDYGAGIMEMAFSNISADEIAAMRARRLLLGEKLPQSASGDVNAVFLESFVRGIGSPLRATEAVFPKLWSNFSKSPELSVKACELHATLVLRLTGVVEHVLRLKLKLGVSPRKYQNVDPPMITVVGKCSLRDAAVSSG